MKAATTDWASAEGAGCTAAQAARNFAGQRFGDDEIAEAQAGKEHLAEGADIEHAPARSMLFSAGSGRPR